MVITSLENNKVKQCIKLQNRKYRDETNLFLIEGLHLVEEAFKTGFLDEVILLEDMNISYNIPKTYVTKEVMKKICNQETIPKIIGICHKKKCNDLGNRILLLDSVQDPGNLGTIIRSSAAFSIDTVVLGIGTVDLYNAKTIRSTQGMIFHVNTINGDLKEIINNIKEKDIPVLGTRVDNGDDVRLFNNCQKEKFALVMGNEGNGVRQEILDMCNKYIYIPMSSNVESLNVAVATSIILYELNRR